MLSQITNLSARDQVELSIIRHAVLTGQLTVPVQEMCLRQYNKFGRARGDLKTDRTPGQIWGMIRAKLQTRKTHFTWRLFSPPLRELQAKRALTALWKRGEIVLVKPGCAARHQSRPAVYRSNITRL